MKLLPRIHQKQFHDSWVRSCARLQGRLYTEYCYEAERRVEDFFQDLNSNSDVITILGLHKRDDKLFQRLRKGLLYQFYHQKFAEMSLGLDVEIPGEPSSLPDKSKRPKGNWAREVSVL